jgi:hypothetical protein
VQLPDAPQNPHGFAGRLPYWCNHCDDNAFSETCWRCHRAADFIPETGSARASRAAVDAPSTAPGAPSRVLVAPLRYVTPPAEWFRRMREAVQDTTP